MSWNVDDNLAVTMHQGDTGAYWMTITPTEGELTDGDVAIYEVWKGKTKLIHREFNLQPAEPTDICPGNGRFLISFVNSDTDTWDPGTYNTEVRVALDPIRSGGQVVDGSNVRTIVQSTITILDVRIKI